MSHPYPYYAATLCKTPEQTYERIFRSKMYVRTDERTEVNLKVTTASDGGPKRFTDIIRSKHARNVDFE